MVIQSNSLIKQMEKKKKKKTEPQKWKGLDHLILLILDKGRGRYLQSMKSNSTVRFWRYLPLNPLYMI